MVTNRWIGIVYLSLFAVLSIYKLWISHVVYGKKKQMAQNQNKPMMSIRILFTIYILCYILSFIFALSSWSMLRDYHSKLWTLPDRFTTVTSLAVSMHILSLCLYYIIMLVWLYTTFKNTSFNINKYMLFIPYGIGLILMSIFISLYLYYKAQTNLWEKSNQFFYPNFLIAVAIINSTIGLSIIYLFVSRLRKIMVSAHFETEKNDELLMHLMTKLTTLGCVSIIFVVSDIIAVVVYQLIVEDDRDWMFGLVLWYSQTLVVFIEILCLYLTFNINKGLYDKLCYGCHEMFKRRTERKVTEERNRQKQQSMIEMKSEDINEDVEFTSQSPHSTQL